VIARGSGSPLPRDARLKVLSIVCSSIPDESVLPLLDADEHSPRSSIRSPSRTLGSPGRRMTCASRRAQGQIRVVVANRPQFVAETDGRSHRACHVGCLGAKTTGNICTRNGDIVLGRTLCLILNMDLVFAVLMTPLPMSDGACPRAMIGPAIGTWLRHVAIGTFSLFTACTILVTSSRTRELLRTQLRTSRNDLHST
jgi:hypothetical protein